MDDDTEVYRSCSATLNGEFYIFGGYSTTNNERKQVDSLFLRQPYDMTQLIWPLSKTINQK